MATDEKRLQVKDEIAKILMCDKIGKATPVLVQQITSTNSVPLMLLMIGQLDKAKHITNSHGRYTMTAIGRAQYSQLNQDA